MRQIDQHHPIVLAEDLSRVFLAGGNTELFAVKKVNLPIYKGEFLVILGRSGSGKTTLLNLLGGLDKPTSGQVHFEGKNLSEMSESEITELRRHRIGFVFQSYGLLPLLSAYENVELPLRINGMPWRDRRHRTEEMLQLIELTSRARHRPYELSGGEQQRVAIARALATKPSLLLADEPTGDLDSTTSATVALLLRDVAQKQGTTVVVATHDLNLARMADRTKELVDGQFVEKPPAL